jgi:integrase
MESETNNAQNTTAGKSQTRRKEILSKDGKWKSFPKVRHLLQYVSTGTYFARVTVNGNLKRKSLDTDVFTTAELRLADFIKKEKGHKLPKYGPKTFNEARIIYENKVADSESSEGTKRYRKFCLKALAESWPELDAMSIARLTERDCEAWASRFKGEVDAQYFNNILGTLRGILKIAGRVGADDPTKEIKRRGVKRTIVDMPNIEQFEKILTEIETSGAGQAKHCADLVRFLAFSGCRLSEAKKVQWKDVDLEAGWITVENAKVRRAADVNDDDLFRSVPIIPAMRELLERIRPENAAGPVCKVHECEKSLTRACARVGVPRLTHHDLRHLFATVCAETVDPQTFSRWLGHRDGGFLAMKTYCHPRKEHEKQMAGKLNFGATGGAK